jgi:hypothetical protein
MSADKFAECFNQYFPCASWFGTVLMMGAVKNHWFEKIANLL